MAVFSNLKAFVDCLSKEGELVQIDAPVSAHLEVAEIHRRVIAAHGPALLFTNVEGSRFPLVTNLFGSRKRVEMAFGPRPFEVIRHLAELPHQLLPPSFESVWKERKFLRSLLSIGMKRVKSAPVVQYEEASQLRDLPLITSWSDDGGAFITLPLVYTEHPKTGVSNLGIYRMQRFDDKTTGIHWQIGKGGGFHYKVAEDMGQTLPLTVFLGGPPALMLAALAPLPENIPEILFASLLLGKRLPRVKVDGVSHPLIAEADFALVGEVLPGERRPEGPFGDHYGYYSLKHEYPVFHCRKVFHREGAIYPATVVGKPRQEDFYLGDFVQELLSPLFPLAMPMVEKLWSYGETGYHPLSAASVKTRYKREALTAAFRILGEGQLSLTKFLLLVDRPIPLRNFSEVLTYVLERARFETDLIVFPATAMDTLDYTGPAVNEGSKAILLGVGDPIRELPREFTGNLPGAFRRAKAFCPGCLVIEGPSYASDREVLRFTLEDAAFRDWPLLILVDSLEKALRSPSHFLWTTFTRFEPAADLFASRRAPVRNALAFSPPIAIDARMKPSYPDELFCDPAVKATVTRRWGEYFKDRKVEMGDGDEVN